jgi:hypothetical protein
MTAKFGTILTALRSTVGGLTGFTTKTEIPNPYVMLSNPIGMLKDGWGLTVGASSPGAAEFNSTVDVITFNFELTRELLSTDNNVEPLMAAIAALKEDATTLMTRLERGDAISADLEGFQYVSTSAVEVIQDASNNPIVTISVSFLGAIRETLT